MDSDSCQSSTPFFNSSYTKHTLFASLPRCQQTSCSSIKKYVQEISYGNQTVEGGISPYWINSSLKISPIEQVEMLKKLYYNQFGFSPENIKSVKDSICLYSTDDAHSPEKQTQKK